MLSLPPAARAAVTSSITASATVCGSRHQHRERRIADEAVQAVAAQQHAIAARAAR